MVGVDELELIILEMESEGCLVSGDALISEVLEYLLEGGLRHAILLNVQARFVLLELTKEPPNRLIFLRHSQFEELTAVLKQLNLFEVFSKESDELEAVLH